MRKRNLSVFALALVMSFIFAVPITAVQPSVYLEPGTQLEVVVPFGEAAIVMQGTGSNVTSANFLADGIEEISSRQIVCCDVNTPTWIRLRVYSNGVHVGYVDLQVCAGCGRLWPV